MENYTTYKPEWAPSDAGKEFACQVMSGIDEVGHPSEPGPARFVRKQYTVDDYVEGSPAAATPSSRIRGRLSLQRSLRSFSSFR